MVGAAAAFSALLLPCLLILTFTPESRPGWGTLCGENLAVLSLTFPLLQPSHVTKYWHYNKKTTLYLCLMYELCLVILCVCMSSWANAALAWRLWLLNASNTSLAGGRDTLSSLNRHVNQNWLCRQMRQQVLFLMQSVRSIWHQLKHVDAFFWWSDEQHILRMRGRFPVVLWLCAHVYHVAGGGYVWGWRVLSDDVSWRNHVWAESGRAVGEEEIKKGAKERKRGALTQQTGLPSPSSYACIRPPTVGDIDPGGAVNGSGMESVCCEGSQRGQRPKGS